MHVLYFLMALVGGIGLSTQASVNSRLSVAVGGMCIDSFGLIQMPVRPVHWWHFVGVGIMLLGLVCFMYGERLFPNFISLN